MGTVVVMETGETHSEGERCTGARRFASLVKSSQLAFAFFHVIVLGFCDFVARFVSGDLSSNV